MILKYIKAALLAAALPAAAMLTGCTETVWTPGPDVSADNLSLYFEPRDSYAMLLGPDDSRIIPVTVSRARTEQAASIPVTVLEAPEGVTVSASVDFAAGQATSTIFVNAESMADKTTGSVVLNLPEDMVSPYGAGTTSLSLKLTTAGSWIPVDTDATVTFGSKFQSVTCALYVMDGTRTFKIPDFLGSGLDFVFVPSPDIAQATAIKPTLRNYMLTADYYETDTYPGWILYDTANADYPEWSPDGGSLKVTWMEFDFEYADMNFSAGTIYLSPFTYFNDGSSTYLDINIKFTPDFNPFTDGAQ